MNRVDDKVALVTGGGSGMGKATCELLAKAGAQVVVTDINLASAKETVKTIMNSGGEAIAIQHDVASEVDWQNAIDLTLAKFKKLDVLVNNAAIPSAGKKSATGQEKDFKDTLLEDWRTVQGVNFDGVFLGMRSAINTMIGNKQTGSIINISSVAALVAEGSLIPYAASKGGVRMLSKAAAIDCKTKRYNIRVNSIYPGGIDTPMRLPIKESVMRKLKQNGLMGEPIDIARGVLFLASDDSSFITGIELVIDGGATASLIVGQLSPDQTNSDTFQRLLQDKEEIIT